MPYLEFRSKLTLDLEVTVVSFGILFSFYYSTTIRINSTKYVHYRSKGITGSTPHELQVWSGGDTRIQQIVSHTGQQAVMVAKVGGRDSPFWVQDLGTAKGLKLSYYDP